MSDNNRRQWSYVRHTEKRSLRVQIYVQIGSLWGKIKTKMLKCFRNISVMNLYIGYEMSPIVWEETMKKLYHCFILFCHVLLHKGENRNISISSLWSVFLCLDIGKFNHILPGYLDWLPLPVKQPWQIRVNQLYEIWHSIMKQNLRKLILIGRFCPSWYPQSKHYLSNTPMKYIASVIKKKHRCAGRHVLNNLREFETFRSSSSGGAKRQSCRIPRYGIKFYD